MARVKDENGLTYQQEMFCRYVVGSFAPDDDERGILVEAYERAYNCRSDSKRKTHYEAASRLMNNCKIAARVEQMRERAAELLDVRLEEVIDMLVARLNFDPLNHKIRDAETGKYRWRRIEEYPKCWRVLLKEQHFNNGGTRYVVDKDKAMDTIVKVKGFGSTTVNNNITTNPFAGDIDIDLDD